MRRREFLGVLGSSAVGWPLTVRAQQPAMPVIGFLHLGSPQGRTQRLAAFRQGLGESGYIEGQNVAIEYRWAEDRYDRLPALAADLGSVLNKDSSAVGVVIQGFRIEGGLDEEATLLAERCRVEAD
jgi:hypothetical protein